MAHRDMRDYLAALEQHGLLKRVARPVDVAWEVACLAKWMYQALPPEKRFGLRFDAVTGFDISVVTAALGANIEAVALALQCEPDAVNDMVVAALRAPQKPVTAPRGLCHEVVHKGGEARLSRLPIVTWTPGKDAAPYITTNVVTRDHDTGIQNMGVYRTQVCDDHSVVVNFANGRQGTRNVKSWTDKGLAAPVAWVIGAEPAVHLATVANLPYGRDEIEFAGGLKGEPITLARCVSHDLMVPAASEIVIEGEVRPGEVADEGPFGEFAGYMGPVEPRPVARITAITHRRDPVYYGYTSQMPPSESTMIQSAMNAGVILHMLRDQIGDGGVRDVYIDQTFGGLLAHGVIAVSTQYPGHGKRVGRIVADATPLKRVTVVDDDVDIRDPAHVDWALNSRYSPARDTVIIDDVFVPIQMDPSVRDGRGGTTPGSKIVVDATLKADAGPFSLPPKAIMEKALETWADSGLPAFDIPRRARLRVDRS